MYKLITLCLVAVGCADFAFADDSAEMPTVARVYHVGNLVSTEAIDVGNYFFGKTTFHQQHRFNSLLAKSRFTKAESAELLSFIPLPPMQFEVALKLGHRTSWGDSDRPSTVTDIH